MIEIKCANYESEVMEMKKLKWYVAITISTMIMFISNFAVMASQGKTVSENKVCEEMAEVCVLESETVSVNQIVDESVEGELDRDKRMEACEDEVEANKAGKSFLAATSINVNTPVSDSIGYIGEDNYYKFTLATPGVVKITFSHPLYECVSGGTDWWICLYNSSRETIYGFSAEDGYTANSYSPQIGLPAGAYYVCIEDFYAPDDVMMMTYTFKVEFQGATTWEKEFNDGWLSATSITANTNIYGSLMQSYDDDYYIFYNNAPKCINISFSHPKFESSITGWEITLYNSNHEIIQSFNASDGYTVSKTGATVFLPMGTYYILVDLYLGNDYHRDSTYSLRVNTQPDLGTVVSYDGLKYKVAKNGIQCYMQCIGPVNKNIKTATIKNEIWSNGFKYPVCQIKSDAFKNCKSLKKIVIGKNMKTIGKNAFYGCKKLESITIQSKKMSTVKKNAFKGIYKKVKVKVPKSKMTKYKKLLKTAGVKSTAKFKY